MTTGNNSERIIVGNCLTCDGLVRIPFSASPNSTVRCPHCADNFRLGDVLDQSLPTLEVVDQPPARTKSTAGPMPGRIDLDSSGQSEDRVPGSRFEVSPILKKGSKLKKKKKRRRRSSRSSESESTPSVTGTGVSISPTETESAIPSVSIMDDGENGSQRAVEYAERRPSSSSSDRSDESGRRRKRSSRQKKAAASSGGGEMFKIMLGMTLALPVAQLLIWWAVGRDPLQLGPVVSKIIPAVVPVDFRTGDEEEETEEPGDSRPVFDPLGEINSGGDSSELDLPTPGNRGQFDRLDFPDGE